MVVSWAVVPVMSPVGGVAGVVVCLAWLVSYTGCWFCPCGGGVGVAGAGWWLRVGCLLRITQWTRASLWSSCQGRTVDALAPGADEGRGRPR